MNRVDWKSQASRSARRLADFIDSGFPDDRYIGREWFMLWQAMTNAYGPELLERGQEDLAARDEFIDEEN